MMWCVRVGATIVCAVFVLAPRLRGPAAAQTVAPNPLAALGVQTAPPESFSVRVVVSGLLDPWEVLWGPDDRLWVTERSAKQIIRIDPATGAKTTLVAIPESYRDDSQDGVLGLVLHSGFLKTPGQDFAYVSFVYNAASEPKVDRRMRLRRYTYDARTQTLADPLDLLTNLPSNDDHAGGRLAFGPDQKLYMTIGDLAGNNNWNACRPNRAQELPTADDINARRWEAYQGKVLRINLDGSIPVDNPTLSGVRSHVFTYGHRNAQGLAFAPDGKLYSAEQGPSTDDELNLLRAGKNYGWPHIAGARDDRSYVYANWSATSPPPCNALAFDPLTAPASVPQQKETAWEHPDFTPPLRTFFTVDATYNFKGQGNATIAPSGTTVYAAAGIPGWANSVLIASLNRGGIFRVKLGADGAAATGPTAMYFAARTRYRDVAVSPDGRTIYASTDKGFSAEYPGSILAFSYVPPAANNATSSFPAVASRD
jgi:PQQ-dependent dehydrogenase (s-GDH family)